MVKHKGTFLLEPETGVILILNLHIMRRINRISRIIIVTLTLGVLLSSKNKSDSPVDIREIEKSIVKVGEKLYASKYEVTNGVQELFNVFKGIWSNRRIQCIFVRLHSMDLNIRKSI